MPSALSPPPQETSERAKAAGILRAEKFLGLADRDPPPDSDRHSAESPPPVSQHTLAKGNHAATGGVVLAGTAAAPVAAGVAGARIIEPHHIIHKYHAERDIYILSDELKVSASVHNIGTGAQPSVPAVLMEPRPSLKPALVPVAAASDDFFAYGAAPDCKPMPANAEGSSQEVVKSRATCHDEGKEASSSSTSATEEGACPAVRKPPQESRPATVEDYKAQIEITGSSVASAYVKVLKVITKCHRRHKTAMKDIRIQKAQFTMINELLVKTLSNTPPSEATLSDFVRTECPSIREALGSLQAQLDRGLSSIYKPSHKNQDRFVLMGGPKADFAVWFADWFSKLDAKFRNYTKLAQGLINEDDLPPSLIRSPSDTTRALEKLSNEGQASLRLKRCLCRTCPERCHPHHTAYLSLEPENSDEGSSRTAGDQLQASESVEATWKCHMAIKSTITKTRSLIWLKVESSVVVELSAQSESVPNHKYHEFEAVESPPPTLTYTEPTEHNPRKRRASSTPPEPVWKAQKTRPHQTVRRISDPGPPSAVDRHSGVEICPEYLAEHNPTAHAVMKIVDGIRCNHLIFYLSEEQRTAYGGARGKPVTLAEVLRKRRHEEYDMLWTLRLCRLVAEAVIRFDLRDSDPCPEDSVVFYPSPTGDLAPFLEVTINKQGQADKTGPVDDLDRQTAGRRGILVNLGLILLRLGLEKGKTLPPAPVGLSGRQSYVCRHISDVSSRMAMAYGKIVRRCARFFSDKDLDGGSTDNSKFTQEFYQRIVQPLEQIEVALLEQQNLGRGLS